MKRFCILLYTIIFITLFSSCPVNPIINPQIEVKDVPILETPDELKSFVDTYDDRINEYFYEYALRYNRVNTLVNSVLFIDHQKTDRASIKALSVSAVNEVDDFIIFCKEMENWGINTFNPALDEAKLLVTDKTFKSPITAKMGDGAYARRLVEMYLDSSYEASFSPADISRHTGVEMSKIRFLMQQVSREFSDDVDIVNEEVIGEQVEFCETVRDTAGAVNSTLALATPLGAFGSATTTAAAATGWIQKAKYTYAVFENTSAAITFTNNVVNIAVKEDNIPSAFKTVANANSYVGLVFGGVGGFTGSNAPDKALAIIGTTTDGVTQYFNVSDNGIKVSEEAQLSTTPNEVDTTNLNGILAHGNYQIPDEDTIDNWKFAAFDWISESETYWEDVYDGIEEITSETYKSYENKFKQFSDSWIANNEKNLTQGETTINNNQLPQFFDYEDESDKFDDHEELDIIPNQEDFVVNIITTGSTGLVPFDVTFKAEPNNRFLKDDLKYYWDFGDGNTLTQIVDSEDFNSEFIHTFESENTFTVKLRAVDVRGYSAESEVEITTGNDLQEVIDSYKGKEAIIHVPPGVYTGSYLNGRVIKLWQNLTLWGNRDSTFINASIEMYPNTKIQGFSLNGSNLGIIWSTDDTSILDNLNTFDIEVIGNNFSGPDEEYGIMLNSIYYNDEEIPYSGKIKDNNIDGEIFITGSTYSGEISYNTIKNTAFSNESIYFTNLIDSTISDNVFENAGGINIFENFENSQIINNTFSNTLYSSSIANYGKMFSDSQVNSNTITNCVAGAGGLYFNEVSEGSIISENNLNNSIINGIKVNKLFGEVSSNQISQNSFSAMIWVVNLEPTGVIKDNIISDNTKETYSGPVDYPSLRVNALKGSVLNNVVTNNSGVGISAGYESGGVLTGNTVSGNSNGGVSISCYDYENVKPLSLIKSSNSIYSNSLFDPSFYYSDLYTPWKDDRIPETPPE